MAEHLEGREAHFARVIHRQPGSEDRLRDGVALLQDLVEGCDHVGVTVATRAGVTTVAATDAVARRGDALQYALDEGPCLDTVRQQHTTLSQDLSRDRRWTSWGPVVVSDLGVNAMLALPLYRRPGAAGALNLYGDAVDPWDEEAIALGHALAGHLAVAIHDAWEIEHRERALIGRTVIGQAQGILMERFGLTADRAFDFLRRVSQDTNRKLVAIAEEVVRTRRVPSGEPSRGSRPAPEREQEPESRQERL